jgi:glycosyltransferase involved in cell wall biosynthesis
MKPLLSVITITYNDGPGLKRTLDSLVKLNEDKSLKWEHIIVDSSPEVNSPVLAGFSGWPLVRIETPPRGIYPAFNLGIEHAQGEYVWFLNGGDRLLTVENLKGLLGEFRGDAFDLVCAPVELYRENKFIYSTRVKSDFLANLLGQNNLCHQGIIYKRSVFERVGFYDVTYKLAGDYEHHFKCYFHGMKFGVFDKPLAQYDRDGRSDNFKEVFREYRRVWSKFSSKLGKQMYLQNILVGKAYFFRSKLMKSKLLSPVAAPLKKIWYRLNR